MKIRFGMWLAGGDRPPLAADPNALQHQEIIFSLLMLVVALMGRGNPLIRYPDLLWAFAVMLAFNLGYHRLLRRGEGAVVPLVSTAVNLALCSLIVGLSGGERSDFWPLYLLPIFTASLHLKRRHVMGVCAAAGAFLSCFYLEALWEARTWDTCEFLIKSGVLVFSAAVTAQLSFKERAQRLGRIDAQNQLPAQAQKLEAVGRLAGGIAHDFNNLLTVIKGSNSFLRSSSGLSEEMRRDVDEIEKAADRAAALTQQLLAFSRKQLLKPEALDVNATLASLDGMVRGLIREDTVFVTRLTPGLGRIRADPGQLSQVIINIVLNARDAMPRGGRLVIETREVEAAGGPLALPAVLITISDSGVGMRSDVLERAFEPFFTTKEQSRGMGLSTVYGIVEQSGGRVVVESSPGQGARFHLYFPRFADAAPAGSATAGRDLAAARSGTVFVVEDEAGVRHLICRILRQQGYEVQAAAGGEEALRLLEAHPGPVRGVVTDIVMPGMGGLALARRLAELRPEVRILYISGYSDALAARSGALAPDSHFLQKPFSPGALADKVREVLA